jgi:FkbM family methyltransferase
VKTLKEAAKNLAFGVLGQQGAYRLGRALYMYARGDEPDGMSSNGELLVQRGALSAFKKNSVTRKKLTVFDIGANVGEWTFSLIEHSKKEGIDEYLELTLFEPVPETANQLRRNVEDRGYSVRRIEEIALSSKYGRSSMAVVDLDSAGINSLHANFFNQSGRRWVEVSLETMSDFCKDSNISNVDLVKCDTEGHDYDVICGAKSLLDEERIQVFQFEYAATWIYAGVFLKNVFDLIANTSYALAKVQRDRLIVYTDYHPEMDKFFYSNYLIIHADALSWYPVAHVHFDKSNVPVLSRKNQ